MSKYGKYIIAILLAIVLSITFWQLVFSRDNSKQTEVSFPEIKPNEISIEAKLDKTEYRSNDQAMIDITITSNKNLKNIMVEVAGMEDRFGENYFQEKKLIDLASEQPTKVAIEKKLPACSTCSGFLEGSYELNINLLKGDYSLEQKKISFALKP